MTNTTHNATQTETGIDWTQAPDFYSPWGSDPEVANKLRWIANHPDATDEDLWNVLDALVLPVDVERICCERLRELNV